jgi:WD40 repeat protein
VSIGSDEGKQLAQPGQAQPPAVAAGESPPEGSRVHVQTASAAESAVVIQVGGDLYLSDAGLTSLWTPTETAPGECPYPGLDSFGPGQAKWFFGREALTGELLRYLDEMALGGPGGPLLVVAPSGTGKSSLLGAGLLNALAEGRLPVPGSALWPRLMITPGSHPLRTLRAALATLATAQTGTGDSRFVVVIDQLEEIFTVCESEAERSEFFDEIGTLAADAGPGSALVVLGMRADFYARATAYQVLRQAMQSRQVVVGAMSATEVRQAIIRPARAVGLTLEAGLTERLLRDLGVDEGASAGEYSAGGYSAGDRASDQIPDGSRSAGGGYEPGRLPLLAHALRATWQHRDGKRLTLAGYEATGGIAGAIARTAEDVYARLDEPGQAAARQIFLGLVRVGEATGDGDGTADTRRRVAADSLLGRVADPVAARNVLDAFTAARLLTSGGHAVEITHEALLRRWPRLRGWLDEDRSGLLVRQELEDAAATWAREGRDAAGLYGGVRLASAQGWAADSVHFRELTQAGRDFLAASERRRRRGTRRRNGLIAVLAALSLLLASLSVFALNQRSDAQANDQKAQAELIAAEAGQAWSDFRPDTALKFAVQADRLDPSSPQVRSTLLTTQAVPITGRLLTNDPEVPNVVGVTFNPAGTIIAGTTQDDKVQLWSAATHRLLWTFQFPKIDGNYAQANGVAFSPNGQIMVVAQQGGPWLFDVANPAHPVHVGTLRVPALPGDPAPQVTSLAFSHGGTMVAAGISTSTNGNAGLMLWWNMATRAVAGVIPEPVITNSLAFTPDGRSLVAGLENGGVDLWDIGRRVRTAVVQAGLPSGDSAGGVAVSPNGQTIAFNAETGTAVYAVKLWSLASRRVTGTATANGAQGMTSVAFSPDGTQLATGSFDGTVRLWAVRSSTPVLLGNFSGHRYPIAHVAFSPDSATLASASDDGTIDLWDTRGAILDGIPNPSDALAFSPDGKTLAISTAVGAHLAIALYSMPARKLAGLLPVSGLAALAFSPDGKTLAVAPTNAPGDPVELWNVATHRMTGQVTTGFTSRINSIAFSPDGTLLAVSAEGGSTVQVWSAARLTRVAVFSDTQQTTFPAQLGGGVFMLAFSPDGRLLVAVGIDGIIRVYGVPGFSLLDAIEPLDATSSLAFSPDGRELAFGNSDGNVYLYSVPATYTRLNGQITYRGAFSASSKSISSVEFLSNDSLVAAGSDSDVRFWSVPSGNFTATAPFTSTTPAQSLATHWGLISAISYSTPLGLLATGSPSGSRVWETNPAQVAASICQTLKAPVSPVLWKEYLPDIPYAPVCG